MPTPAHPSQLHLSSLVLCGLFLGLVGGTSGRAEAAPPAKAKAKAGAKPGAKAKLVEGDGCKLTKPIKLSEKPGGKGKKSLVKAGETLLVSSIEKNAAEVASETGIIGYIPVGFLSKFCIKIEEAVSPPAEPTPPAPVVGEPVPPAGPDTTASPPAPADTPPPPAPAEAPGSGTPSELAPAQAAPPTEPATSPPPAVGRAPSHGDAVGKTKIAVMDLRRADNIDKDLAQSLGALIPQVLDEIGPFKAISSQDIVQMLQLEASKQQLGCDSASCLAEIGGALGADYMVSGSILLAGDTFLIQLQLMNIANSRVDGRASREYKGGPAGLFDEMKTATKLVVRDILATKSGKLVLSVSEEGATIRLDGTIVGTSPMPPQTVPGGMHTVTVDKEGFIRFSTDVEIKANDEVRTQVAMRPSEDFLASYRSRAGTMRTLAWTAIAVGVSGLGAAGATYLANGPKATALAKDIRAYNQSPAPTQADYNKLQQTRKSVATMDALTLVAGSIGLVSGVVGALLYTLGDNPHRYDSLNVSTSVSSSDEIRPALSFAMTPHGVGIAVGF